MSETLNGLIARWRGDGLNPVQGAAPAAIESFESRFGIVLPSDLREYLSTRNGMLPGYPNDIDKEGFAFWPLERIRPISTGPDKIPWNSGLPDASKCFLFADYLHWSWAYAIVLSRESSGSSPVFIVGVEHPKKIADSFSEFARLYLARSPALLAGQAL
jgi:hypothetical protein